MKEKTTYTADDMGMVHKIIRMFKAANLPPDTASGMLAASEAAIIFMLQESYPELAGKEDELISDFARCVRLNLDQLRKNRLTENN